MVLEFSLGFSVVMNVVLASFLIFLLRKAKAVKKNASYDCTQLLHDLTAGRALVRVERVDQAEVFLRSFRG